MSDTPLSMKLSCKSPFSAPIQIQPCILISTTLQLVRRAARFNQIYLKLRARDQGSETEMKRWDGKKKKTPNSSDILFPSFSLSPLLFNSVQNTYTMILICCARMHRFDMKLCYSFTYLCAMQHVSSDFNVY